MRLVLASNNAKKLDELRAVMALPDVELVAQGALGIPEVDEPHRSFVENALTKARHAARHANGAALADDSGLCVNALAGLPGVDSAHIAPVPIDPAVEREAWRTLQDEANNEWLLARLRDVDDRRAHYLCVLVALRGVDDPEPLIAVGRWRGVVMHRPEGKGGFGYDPLMRMDGSSSSVAAMDAAAKQRSSHRAIAATELVAQMRTVWRVGGG
jgi:XTP/dITP diphosphohydrolase